MSWFDSSSHPIPTGCTPPVCARNRQLVRSPAAFKPLQQPRCNLTMLSRPTWRLAVDRSSAADCGHEGGFNVKMPMNCFTLKEIQYLHTKYSRITTFNQTKIHYLLHWPCILELPKNGRSISNTDSHPPTTISRSARPEVRTATAVLRPREEKVPKRMGDMGEIFGGDHLIEKRWVSPFFFVIFCVFFEGFGKTEVQCFVFFVLKEIWF